MEENKSKNEKGPLRSYWKLILVLFLSFILFSSLIYYVLPHVLSPLRIDKIPPDAYVIPWMRPSTSIETLRRLQRRDLPWDIDSTMTEALRLNITFTMTMNNRTHAIPSTIYIGHDAEYLYIGGEFFGMGPNPNSRVDEGYVPSFFNLLFDTDNDGMLIFPESGSSANIIVLPYVVTYSPGSKPSRWENMFSGGYDDLIWTDYDTNVQSGYWSHAQDYYNNMRTHWPEPATRTWAAQYDNFTGTLTVLYPRRLWQPNYPYTNRLQMRSGERWVMGFLIELGFYKLRLEDTYVVDGWPQKTYPYLNNDASWWPKLVIDLTNPPSGFN